jgi:FtsX-like permease family protein
MLVRDTGNLQLPVSLTEIRAPLAVAAARLRAQPLRPALLVGGVALAFALLLSVLGGTLIARQQSLHRTLAALPQSERGFRIDRFGLPLDPGGYGQADRRARRALAALGAGETRRVVLFRELRVQGELVELAASDDLASIVRVRSGRLPRSCTAGGCELLQIGGGGSSRLDEGGLHLRRVGVAALRDPQIFGDVTASTSGSGTAPLLLLAPSVDSLQRLAALSPFYRVYSWVSPLRLDRLHTWDVDRVFADESRAQSLIGADPAMRLSGPDAALADATSRGRVAADRLVLVGGELSALLLGFALIAAIGLRRGLAAERRRLLTRGARRWQGALASTAEIGAVTLGGALLGLCAAAVIIAAVASAAGLPAGPILEHTLSAGRTLAAVGCGWAAITLLLTLVTYTREGEGTGRRVTVLDVAAVGAAGTIAVALGRGALDPESLTFGGTVLFLLLPLLVCFVVAVVLARLLGPAMRGAERLTRRSRISLRLAVLALARAPTRTVASCAFVAVALGLALFAAAYRGTLARGASDQAGFEVPLDFTLAEGPRLVRPLDAAAPSSLARLGGAFPVLRLSATAPGRGSVVLSPTVLGVPSGALRRMFWRSDFGPRPRLAGGKVRLAGRTVPAGRVSLATGGTDRGLDVRLAIEDARGRVRTIPLRPRRGGLSAELPTGRLVGLELALTNLQQFALAHRETEAEVTTAPTGTIELGPLRAGGRVLTDWSGWRLPGARVTRNGERLRIGFTFPDTGASLAFRPPEPTDGRPMSVFASPDLAAAAGGVGHTTVLDFQDVRVPVRIVGVVRRLPTVSADSGPFVLAEESRLSTAMNAGAPGRGTPNEIWLSARDEHQAAAAFARTPFSSLAVTSRSAVDHRLATDPLAHATELALGAAALVALALAVLGFWVGVLSELRDERSDFYDLEAQGVAPAGLRAQLRVRAAILVALGLAGGALLGLLLSRLVVSLVRISGTTAVPEPPLRFDAAWLATGLLFAALLVLALLVAEGTSLSAFRDERPTRTSWSLE